MMQATNNFGALARCLGMLVSVLCLTVSVNFDAQAKGKTGPRWSVEKPADILALGPQLIEVSGLAYSGNGHLIALNDEIARSFFLDTDDGKIRDVFEFKRRGRSYLGDFEGVAKVGKAIWMINSRGFLLRSVPGTDEVATYNTGLEDVCEVEGLAWWAKRETFLIACKKTYTDNYGDTQLFNKAVIFQWSVETKSLVARPFTIGLKKLKKRYGFKTFRPSGLTVTASGNKIVVLSSKEKAIVVLSRKGKLLSGQRLRGKYHPQPEGIALLPDGSMVIADEGKRGPATLTLYRRAKTR